MIASCYERLACQNVSPFCVNWLVKLVQSSTGQKDDVTGHSRFTSFNALVSTSCALLGSYKCFCVFINILFFKMERNMIKLHLMYDLVLRFRILFILRYISCHVNRPLIFIMAPNVMLFFPFGNEIPLLPLHCFPASMPQIPKSLDHAMAFRPLLIAECKLCPKDGAQM